MIRLNWISKLEPYLKWLAVVCGVLIAASGALLKFERRDYQLQAFNDILELNLVIAWLMIPALTAIGSGATYFKTHFGTLNTWKTVSSLLEEYKKAVFASRPELKNDPAHYQRITLYKYTGWRWAFCWLPWTGWMIPVARTGHTTHRSSIPRFRAPKGRPENAEGVAGVAFVNNSVIPVSDLPDLSVNKSDPQKVQYARDGFVSTRWIDKRESCQSRSLLGIPIEVKGTPWGVIVIDSVHPEPICSIETITDGQFSILGKLLSKLLEH